MLPSQTARTITFLHAFVLTDTDPCMAMWLSVLPTTCKKHFMLTISHDLCFWNSEHRGCESCVCLLLMWAPVGASLKFVHAPKF